MKIIRISFSNAIPEFALTVCHDELHLYAQSNNKIVTDENKLLLDTLHKKQSTVEDLLECLSRTNDLLGNPIVKYMYVNDEPIFNHDGAKLLRELCQNYLPGGLMSIFSSRPTLSIFDPIPDFSLFSNSNTNRILPYDVKIC